MRSQCSMAICLKFCVRSSLAESKSHAVPCVCDLQKEIATFLHQVKLRLWDAQLANGQLEHFPRLAACVPDDVEPDTCVSVVASLREEFASRFAGVRPLAADFKLFTGPFDFPVYDAPATCRWSWWSYSVMMN